MVVDFAGMRLRGAARLGGHKRSLSSARRSIFLTVCAVLRTAALVTKGPWFLNVLNKIIRIWSCDRSFPKSISEFIDTNPISPPLIINTFFTSRCNLRVITSFLVFPNMSVTAATPSPAPMPVSAPPTLGRLSNRPAWPISPGTPNPPIKAC